MCMCPDTEILSGHQWGPTAPWGCEWAWGTPPGGSGQGLAARDHPTAPARSRAGGALGQPPPPASGSSLGMGMGWGQARTRARGWAWLSEAHGWAGQGCGELQTGPAVASLGQGLAAPGGWHGVLGHGQGVGSSGGLGRDSQG